MGGDAGQGDSGPLSSSDRVSKKGGLPVRLGEPPLGGNMKSRGRGGGQRAKELGTPCACAKPQEQFRRRGTCEKKKP